MNLMPMNNPITVDVGANIEYINKLLADDEAGKRGRERAAEGGNMIIIMPPEYQGRKCNVCGDKDACCEINFRNDYNNHGVIVALCRNCVSTLSYLIESYKVET